jgi:hypothetical protein
MTNWHALPLEVKSLILEAYIDCVTHEGGHDEWRVSPDVLWYLPPSTQAVSLNNYPQEFTLTTFLFVAPELQSTASRLIDKKLSASTKIESGPRVSWRKLKGADVEVCKLSAMRRGIFCEVPFRVLIRSHSCCERHAYGFTGLGSEFANQQIEEASAKYQQPSQK